MNATQIHPGRQSAVAPDAKPSSAWLFSIIWEALADLLGTPTTAVILRRAAHRAERGSPQLAELVISAGKTDFSFVVPPAWADDAEAKPHALQTLLDEVISLLLALTGPSGVRRLQHLPELRARGLRLNLPEEESPMYVNGRAYRRRSFTRLLPDIAHVLGSVDAPDDRLRRALQLLRAVVPFDVAVVVEVKAGEAPRSLIEPEPSADERAAIIATVDRLLSHLLADRPPEREPAPAVAGRLAVPLVSCGEVRGILSVSRASGPYSEAHLEALAIVAGQLAAYLGMAQAHEKLEARARELDRARLVALAADRMKEDVLAVVSRQLKDPVAATLTWGNTLLSAMADFTAQSLSPAQAPACVCEASPHAVGSGPGPGKGQHEPHVLDGVKVLLVDDDWDILEAFQMLLELHGANVTAAASAEAAMVAFERSRPDVLLCDISMPGSDGYDLMRQIAARDPALPAAALSAFAEPPDPGRARAAGFRKQLCKPIEAAGLVAVVLELAARRSAAATGERPQQGEGG